jgi:mono/diheme cytochrome c family protein
MHDSSITWKWLALGAAVFLAPHSPLLAADSATSEAALTYERDVRPLFKAHCFHCHGEGGELKGGLDLRLRRLLVKGGDSGEALVPGKPEESPLFDRIQKAEMPPGDKKKLSPAEVALIRNWIAQGANTKAPEPAEVGTEIEITPEEREFWAFQSIQTPPAPTVQHPEQIRTPIDAFLLAGLEQKGLTFSAEADKRTLLRRACFDLLGLPPSPEEVQQFLADEAPDAYERLIERLLTSPHYGERWGRHWLDIAGYADSDGYTPEDPIRPYAYKYRDYVIRSINADKPFDQFIQEQLAGDEMVPQPYQNLSAESLDKLVATGFLRTAADGTGSGVDQKVARNQVIADTLRIVSTSLLGLSVGCAQCHNHRYDPILQTDYYRMRAIFEPAYNGQNWRAPRGRLISLYTDADREQAKQIEAEAAKIDAERLKKQEVYIEETFQKELAKLPEELRESIRMARSTPADKKTPEQQKLLKENPSVNVTAGSLYLYDPKAAEDLKKEAERAAQVRATKPVEDFVSPLTEIPGQVPETFLFHRGDPDQPKQALPPGELAVLDASGTGQIPVKDPALPTSGRRLAYARHLTDGKHPLTARVLVNRIWMNHFGRGIVGTPADFGALGQRPTHPELLDWLASDFMAGGWKLKRVHQLIMTSTAYRQTSRRNPSQDAADPENLLYGRMSVRRLEAEDVRDSVLALSGKLHVKMFGSPVPVIEDEVGQFVVGIENLNGENRPGPVIPLNGEEFRRSMYVQARRSRPLAVLDTFDLPAMEPNCESRASSTVTPQSLMLMNSEFVVAHSEQFARRIQQEAASDPRAQVARAWQLAFCREPTEVELNEATAFVTVQAEHYRQQPPPAAAAPSAGRPAAETPDSQLRALSTFCQALLSANEFLYVE